MLGHEEETRASERDRRTTSPNRPPKPNPPTSGREGMGRGVTLAEHDEQSAQNASPSWHRETIIRYPQLHMRGKVGESSHSSPNSQHSDRSESEELPAIFARVRQTESSCWYRYWWDESSSVRGFLSQRPIGFRRGRARKSLACELRVGGEKEQQWEQGIWVEFGDGVCAGGGDGAAQGHGAVQVAGAHRWGVDGRPRRPRARRMLSFLLFKILCCHSAFSAPNPVSCFCYLKIARVCCCSATLVSSIR